MIELRGVSARVGAFELRDVSFTIPASGYGVVIGPAGSGKTTLLETIAGINAGRGSILLGGRDVTTAPMESRDIGLVYQHGFLFPHLSVARNIAYGARGTAVVEELMHTLDLEPLAARAVGSLSGGERQVVALARALARQPATLLLDEPFSALDPRRRVQVRRQVRDIHRRSSTTILQVTHDFAEAGLLGDMMVLLDNGRLLQWGTPADVFSRPASAYVAEFLGAENVLAGVAVTVGVPGEPGEMHEVEVRCGELLLRAVGDIPDGPIHAVIRAEEIVVAREESETSMRNHFAGVIVDITGVGAQARITVDVTGVPLVAALTWRSVRDLALANGEKVFVSFKAFAVHLC
ncbi:MAG: ATP-binding cassette domain-containing protein [Gemmatimonadota bacterium]